MHVVEAILIGLVMLTAVSFVITFSPTQNVSEPTRAKLGQTASDSLEVMNEFPLNDARYGNNTLSKYIFQCLQHQCTNLTTQLNTLLPASTSYDVYLNNGYGTLPVYVPQTPYGQSVTTTFPLEPRLSYAWSTVADDQVNPATSTLGLFVLPVVNSNPMTDGAAPLEIRVEGIENQNERTFNLTAYYSTEEGSAGSGLPSASLMYYHSWSHLNNTPGLTFDRSPTSNDSSNTSMWLELREDEGQSIPAGTTLTIVSPPGFDLAAWGGLSTSYEAGWNTPIKIGTAATGETLTTSLKSALTNGVIRFRYNATPSLTPSTTPESDFYHIEARLGHGAYSVADAIVKMKTSPTGSGVDVPGIVASIAKPMGITHGARIGVGIQEETIGSPQNTITVQRVEIVQTNGNPIFGSVTGVGPLLGGSWALGPLVNGSTGSASVIWKGQHVMGSSAIDNLTIDVGGTGFQTAAVPLSHEGATMKFANATTFSLLGETAPGLYYGEVPANNGSGVGYYWTAQGGQYSLTSLVSPVTAPGSTIPGTWQYNSSALGTPRDPLSLANITFSSRSIPIGQTEMISIDAINMLLNLSQRGVPATTTIRLYAPWALDQHIPLLVNTTQEHSVVSSGVQGILLQNYDGDSTKDVVVITTDNNIYVLDGQNGYRIPGFSYQISSPTVSFAAIEYLEANDTAHQHPYIVIGGSPNALGNNLFVLGPNFQQFWATRVAAIGGTGPSILSVDMLPDTGHDYYNDLAVGDSTGAFYIVEGKTGQVLASKVVPNSNAALVAAGKWGAAATSGLATTEGPAVKGTANVTLGSSTFINGSDTTANAVKSVVIEQSTGGLGAYDTNLNQLWDYGNSFTGYQLTHLDKTIVSDVVGVNWDGTVAALNGTQPAPPFGGITIASGPEILDGATAGSPYNFWSIDNAGLLMFSNDGYTTRDYAGPVSSLLPATTAVPGARAITMASATTGWVVGDYGNLWEGTSANSYASARWAPEPYTINVAPSITTAGLMFKSIRALSSTNLVAAAQCLANCSVTYANEAIVLYSTNGGSSWTPGTFTITPTGQPSRLYFYSANAGYLLTTQGEIYFSSNQGVTWSKLATIGVTGGLNGIAFTSANNGWVVGALGSIYQTTNGGATWAKPAKLPASLPANTLQDVTFADAFNGTIVGSGGVVLVTHDAGKTWIALPNDGVDYIRALTPLPNFGYLLGGTAGTRYIAIMGAYASTSVAYTTIDHATTNPIQWVTIHPVTHNFDGYTNVSYALSTDNGLTWHNAVLNTTGSTATTDNLGNLPYYSTYVGAQSNTSLLVRMTLTVSIPFPHVSPQIDSIPMTVSFMNGSSNVTAAASAVFPTTKALGAGSTAVFDSAASAVRAPRISTFWSQLVNGSVQSEAVGQDVNHDGIPDVVVGTGDQMVSQGVSANTADNRVYMISGSNGAILWQTAQLPGRVASVSFANLAGLSGSSGEGVIAVVECNPNSVSSKCTSTNSCPASTFATQIYFLDGRTGAILPSPTSYYPICSAWAGTGVGDLNKDGTDDFVIGMNPTSGPGWVVAINGATTNQLWRMIPSIKGLYQIAYPVPMNSLFGPYIVEVEVSGTQTETIGGHSVQVEFDAKDVNYFLVTPPDGHMPISPVYTIDLVTWYDDWDFSTGTT
ncbi:MAG: YCF48-related protein [Thermoplasmatota archaeon]